MEKGSLGSQYADANFIFFRPALPQYMQMCDSCVYWVGGGRNNVKGVRAAAFDAHTHTRKNAFRSLATPAPRQPDSSSRQPALRKQMCGVSHCQQTLLHFFLVNPAPLSARARQNIFQFLSSPQSHLLCLCCHFVLNYTKARERRALRSPALSNFSFLRAPGRGGILMGRRNLDD
jgi:hypothetical protein